MSFVDDNGVSCFIDDNGITSFVDDNGVLLSCGSTSTTTALSASPNPSTYLQSILFTAVVSGSGGTPTGTVLFQDGGVTFGTVSLSSGTATLSWPSLSIGSHTITAVYGGDSTFAGSTSNAVTQVVNAPASPVGNFTLMGQICT